MKYGVAGYAIVRETEKEARDEITRITDVKPGTPGYANYQDWLANTQLEQRVTLEEYSVSNRGLRALGPAPPTAACPVAHSISP